MPSETSLERIGKWAKAWCIQFPTPMTDALIAEFNAASEQAQVAALNAAALHQAHYHFSPADGRILVAECACGAKFDPDLPTCPQLEAHIRALATPAIRAAWDNALREARLEEAKWWCAGHICENARDCPGCKRFSELSTPAKGAKP